jgi:hypothetical protein
MNMRKLYFIVAILGILSTGLSAEQKNRPFAKQWKKIERYGGDLDPRSDVQMLKIYGFNLDVVMRDHPYRYERDKTTDKRSRKKFLKLKEPPKISDSDLPNDAYAYMLDKHGKIWQMNEKKDLLDMLDGINTGNEVLAALWMDGKDFGLRFHGGRYRKHPKGIEVEIYNKKKGEVCPLYTDRFILSKQGNVLTYQPKAAMKKCSKKLSKYIANFKNPDFQEYKAVDSDKHDNIYVAGSAMQEKVSDLGYLDRNNIVTVEKYNKKGKRLWRRYIKHAKRNIYADHIAILGKRLFVWGHREKVKTAGYRQFIAVYLLSGKRISYKEFGSQEESYLSKDGSLYFVKYHNGLSKLHKYDRNGMYQWSKQIDMGKHFMIHHITITKNGKIYIVGNVYKEKVLGKRSSKIYDDRAFVAKLDENGNKLWDKIYTDFKSFDYVTVDRSGNICLAAENGRLLALNKDGKLTWQRKIYPKYIERLKHAEEGVLVSGRDTKGFSIKHYGSDGKLQKRYMIGLKGISLFSYKYTKKGDLLAVGNQSLLPANFEGFCDVGEDKNAAVLLKYGKSGKLLWKKLIGGDR